MESFPCRHLKQSPQEIIDRLKADSAAYQAAAQKEGEFGAGLLRSQVLATREADQWRRGIWASTTASPAFPSG